MGSMTFEGLNTGHPLFAPACAKGPSRFGPKTSGVMEGKSVFRAAGIYDPAETRSPAARAHDAEVALRTVLRRAAATASAVREALSVAGLIPEDAHVADLERIPVTRKERLPGLQVQVPPLWGMARPPDGGGPPHLRVTRSDL